MHHWIYHRHLDLCGSPLINIRGVFGLDPVMQCLILLVHGEINNQQTSGICSLPVCSTPRSSIHLLFWDGGIWEAARPVLVVIICSNCDTFSFQLVSVRRTFHWASFNRCVDEEQLRDDDTTEAPLVFVRLYFW